MGMRDEAKRADSAGKTEVTDHGDAPGKREVGHVFLARLGKKRLRPGGIRATNWLMSQAGFSAESNVLEVACNRCITSIELVKRYGCNITALDMDGKVLEKARVNVRNNNLEHKITIIQGNAMKLPFEDHSFDIIVNEAMLTMLPLQAKAKAVAEYYRVLRPGGVLLTHDVMVAKEDKADIVERLRETININVTPLPMSGWRETFAAQGFTDITVTHGRMTLMNPRGMIRDEGLLGMATIIRNGLKKENRAMFRRMFTFFNHADVSLEYIAVCSRKPGGATS